MVAFLGVAPGFAEKFFGKAVQTSFGRLQYLACPTITSSLTDDVIPSRDLLVQLGNDIAASESIPPAYGGLEDHLPHRPSGLRHGTYSPSLLPASSLSSTPNRRQFLPGGCCLPGTM
jgi:hypothetical protein